MHEPNRHPFFVSQGTSCGPAFSHTYTPVGETHTRSVAQMSADTPGPASVGATASAMDDFPPEPTTGPASFSPDGLPPVPSPAASGFFSSRFAPSLEHASSTRHRAKTTLVDVFMNGSFGLLQAKRDEFRHAEARARCDVQAISGDCRRSVDSGGSRMGPHRVSGIL